MPQSLWNLARVKWFSSGVLAMLFSIIKASLDMRKIFPIVLFIMALASALALTNRFQLSRNVHHLPEALDAEDVGAQQLWNYLRLRDPATGEIPAGIRARELAYARSLRGPAYKENLTIHTTGWNSAGPSDAGGRTRAIGIDTMNEANVLIATAQGGVFRSTDSGMSWVRTTAPGEIKDMSSLVQDHRPGKTNIWYAGTGELISTTWRRTAVYTEPDWHSATIGNGIYKSTDDGMSWSVLPSTVTSNTTVLDSAFEGVWNVVVDNSRRDSDVVYAAAFGAILRSNDGGLSWSRVLGDPAHASLATDVAITSSGVVYAYLSGSSADGAIPATAGVWRTPDGFHWTNITPDNWSSTTGRMRLAIASGDENVVYLGGADPNVWYGAVLFKYDYYWGNGSGTGGAWFNRSAHVPASVDSVTSAGLNTYGGYCVTLSVYPTDTNIVFFGGTNLYRSWDGFATADRVEWIGGYNPSTGQYGEPNNDHPDHHDLVFIPSNPSEAYDATDGGMFMTYDVLGYDDPTFVVTWQNINYNDQASILYDVALDHASPGDSTILGGFQDQGSWLYWDTNVWIPYWGGDGCYCAIADLKSAYYMSSQFGGVVRLTISSNTMQGFAGLMPSAAQQAQFVTPWMLDPANTDEMYFADNNSLWRNDDLAGVPDNQQSTTDVNWEELTTCRLPLARDITALGMSRFPAHRLYYGSSDGHLYRVDTADGVSPAPTEITGSIFPKNAYISCIAVDPQNADSIVVCFSNYHVISIFASNDGGATWRDASGNLEQNPDGSGDGPSVRWVSIIHQQGQTLYLCGTDVGLFSTTDLSGPTVTWVPEGQNAIGYAIVENIDVRQSDGFVAIATQGSGVFTTHVVASPSVVSPARTEASAAFTISPNPAVSRFTISLGMARTIGTKIRLVDMEGNQVLSEANFPAGEGHFSFDCSRLPSGTYFVQLEAGDAVETRKLIIER